MGIATEQAAQFGKGKVLNANLAVAQKLSRMRGQKASGQDAVNEFTAEERKSME